MPRRMFSETTLSRFPETHWVLLKRLIEVIDLLREGSRHPIAFPQTKKPVAFFNGYIDFGVTAYCAKLLQLYEAVAHAIEHELYVVYAQCGRAILENVATIRYYSRHEDLIAARKAWDSSSMNDPILRKANESLDKFIRGNRFAWDAFVEGRLDQLSRSPHQEHLSQINSMTALQKWFKEVPQGESLYDLFCDLVHPNLGSNLLVLRSAADGLTAGGSSGNSPCMFVVAPTLAGILGAYKEFERASSSMRSFKLESGG